ncbi:hypothetical protein SPIRO4BDMA_50403 [uncultured spirochete]|uniref:Leucine-binding protein domain-containing protein n=1 Tax=uncultured spirochete TaxID=156406 RepID=A0A3P3XRE6_9SPIR|nr:hypothetical protein SPIRO4BDMA_50403 [uncultured spirochete]
MARDAIQRAGSLDKDKVREAIAVTKDYPGATGMITLNEDGDAVKSAVIKTVKDGKFVYMATVQPY